MIEMVWVLHLTAIILNFKLDTTGEKLSIKVGIMDLTYWSVRSSSRSGMDELNGVDWGSLFQPATNFNLLEYRIIWCEDPNDNESIL